MRSTRRCCRRSSPCSRSPRSRRNSANVTRHKKGSPSGLLFLRTPRAAHVWSPRLCNRKWTIVVDGLRFGRTSSTLCAWRRGSMNWRFIPRRFWIGGLRVLSGPLVTAGSAHHHDKEDARASWCRDDSLRYAEPVGTRGALATEGWHVASSHVCSGWTLRP